MSTGKMRLQYHPVLKKMAFERYENGRWTDANGSSRLHKYVSQRTPQLLQNFGDELFQDIVDSMDNITDIFLDFKGTREDYEDLKKMIGHYQISKKDRRNLSIGELTELAAVKDLFNDITSFSHETSDAFWQFVEEVEGGQGHGEVHSICGSLKAWLTTLDKKREGLAEDAVNLCFVGAFSSGKSTLISALIGESILPEAIGAETAKMFKITQIRKDSDETPSISFNLVGKDPGDDRDVQILWDREGRASLIGWPLNNPVREAVQSALNETAGKKLHLQVKTVLTAINTQPGAEKYKDKETGEIRSHDSYIDGIVNIRYPVDLDAQVLFHIYDTPGTDSNNPEHLKTLKAALEDPASSILVYVNDPVKLEGAANSILLNILGAKDTRRDEQEASDSSTIDLSRSFFVINRADTLKDEKALRDLQAGTLSMSRTDFAEDAGMQTAEEWNGAESETQKEYHRPFEIKLNEKRLFFTDALHAGDARAVEKGIMGGDEVKRLKEWECLVSTEWRHLYKYDIMARADTDTERLKADAIAELERLPDPIMQMEEEKKKWADAFAEAVRQGMDAGTFMSQHPMPTEKSFGPQAEAYYICSGVYSLQKEIERYAERFALAVRAKGIIDGTRILIGNLETRCGEAKRTLNTNIDSLNRQIFAIKDQLTKKVETLCSNYGSEEISIEEEIRLGLDRESILSRRKKLEQKLNEIIDTGIVFGSKKSNQMEKHANEAIQKAIKDFYQSYAKKYPIYLDKTQDALIKKIEQEIEAQKELDQSTKDRLKGLRKQKIKGPSNHAEKISLRGTKFLFITFINKDGFIDKAVVEFLAALDKLKEQYTEQFRQMKSSLAKEVKHQYQARVDEFAGEVIRLNEDRVGFEQELQKLEALLADVQDRERVLTNKINREVEKEAKA